MASRFLNSLKINDAYTLPSSDGSNGQVIVTDGSGNLAFANPSTSSSASIIYRDNFTGDGSTVAFTLQNSLSDEDQTFIYIDGVYQEKGTYSLSTNTITFTTAPDTGHSIEVISVSGINVGPTTIYQDNFTGDGTTTDFTLAQVIDNEVKTMIYFNGVYQFKGTYSLNGTALSFDTAPANGVDIEVISIASAAAADYNQKVLFYGKASEAISKGDAIMLGGQQGDHFLLSKATQSAIAANHEYFLGLASQDLAQGEFGYVTEFGKIIELNTSTYTAGDILWFDAGGSTAGALTTTEPAAPLVKIQVASVIRSHQNEGVIFIRPTWYHELGELHDVNITSVADKDILAWNNTQAYWENTKTLDSLTANTLSATTLTGTLSTAAQTNITSVGTLSGLDLNGVVDLTDLAYFVGSSNYGFRFNNSADSFNNVIFYDNGNAYFRGNIGIGTTSPTHKLTLRNDVAATTDLDPTTIKLYNNSDGGAAIEFSNAVAGNSKLSFGVEGSGGYTDETYIGFSTSVNGATASEKMRINSVGEVGIGTSNPVRKLVVSNGGANGIEIDPNISGNSEIISYNRSTSSYTPLYFEASAYYLGSGNVGIGNTNPTSYSGYKVLHIGNNSTGGLGLIKFANGVTMDGPELYANGNSLRLNTNGNTNVLNIVGSDVGIGMTNPSYKLDVNSTSGARIQVATGGYNWLTLSSGFTGNASIGINDSGGSGKLGIYQYDSSGNYVRTALNLDSSGSLGINTTSTRQKLVVNGHAEVTASNSFKASYNNTDSYHGALSWATLQLGNNGDNRIIGGRTATGGNLSFYVNNTNDATSYSTAPDGTLAMHIASSGNVGIGTTSPSYKLQVNGDMRVTSNVRLGTDLNTSVTIGQAQNSQPASSDTKLVLSGKNLEAGGTYYGDYGQLLFNATSNYTGSARKWLITNGLDAYKFSIIMGDSGQVTPTIGTAGGASNGTPVLTIDDNGDVGVGTINPNYKLSVSGNIVALDANASSPSYTYFGLFTENGSLPGYPSNSFATLKTDDTDMYFSANGAYTAFCGWDSSNGWGYFGVKNSASSRNTIIRGGNGDSEFTGEVKRVGIGTNGSYYIALSGNLSGYTSNAYNAIKTNQGDMHFDVGGVYTGYISSNSGFVDVSDASLKTNVEYITDALTIVSNLKGRKYNWINENRGVGKQVGFIAQEVEEFVPEVVTEGAEGTKGVAYGKLTAVLVEAIKEQQAIIEDLKARIETLENN